MYIGRYIRMDRVVPRGLPVPEPLSIGPLREVVLVEPLVSPVPERVVVPPPVVVADDELVCA